MTKPNRTISVTEAARNIADVVNRAFYRNETTILLKNGVAVAHIAPVAPTGIPASELLTRLPLLPHLSATDANDFARDIAKARSELPKPVDKWAS